jgi:transcriptional regulator with XRE-family HTH domain
MNAKTLARRRPGVATDRGPLAVDMHVGARVRMRRKFLGISQQALAAQLGITFQQVQKYERGANRVSASKLYEIARALEAPVSFFFEGLAETSAPRRAPQRVEALEQSIGGFLQSEEGLELASAFARLAPGRLRRQVLDLVRAIAEEDTNN